MALIAFRPFSKMFCYFAFAKKYFFIFLVFIHGLKYLHTFLTKDFFQVAIKNFFCIAREENGIKMTACPSSLSAPSFVIQNFHKMLKSVVFHLRGSYFAMLWALSSMLVKTLGLTMRLTAISGKILEVALRQSISLR